MASEPDPLPAPPSPVLLYLGAGYDLSPLLTFSPNPPYHISSTATTYTSFLFADAKPRHTSAFMVPDFDQWIDVPSRVRNILRYSQGMLHRWRVINDDLIWFEGGGSPSHIAARHADPAWHSLPQPHSQQHLVTLHYVFNTLDIELARIAALTHVWPHVAALYIHGLRPHPSTGLDLLLTSLEHVYVLVGSWGTPRRARVRGVGGQRGVRDVDFVRAARKRWRLQQQDKDKEHAHAHAHAHGHTLGHTLGHTHTAPSHALTVPAHAHTTSAPLSHPDSDADSEATSPLIFRRSLHSDSDSDSDSDSCSSGDIDVDVNDLVAATSPPHLPPRQRSPFYTRIPQIAWDDTRNAYVVSKTVAQSLAVWRARAGGGPGLETETEDSAGDDDDDEEEGVLRSVIGVDVIDRERDRDRDRRPARLRLRPRPPASPEATSSSTDVSDTARAPTSFWRRAMFVPKTKRARKRRIGLADFLRTETASPRSATATTTATSSYTSSPPYPSSSLPYSAPYTPPPPSSSPSPYPRHTRSLSCPDLKPSLPPRRRHRAVFFSRLGVKSLQSRPHARADSCESDVTRVGEV